MRHYGRSVWAFLGCMAMNGIANGINDEGVDEVVISRQSATLQPLDLNQESMSNPGEDAPSTEVFAPFDSYIEEYRRISAQQPQLFAKKKYATLMVSGGFGSCQDLPRFSYIFERSAISLKKALREGIVFRVIATCYSKVSTNISVYVSWKPGELFTGTEAQIAQALATTVKRTPGEKLYLVGHSYGGWLAMKVASLMKTTNIVGLTTIDPISHENCTPAWVVWSYLRSQFDVWPHQGCTEAPADFDAATKQAVKLRTKWWNNFFEIESVFLHSGVIQEARNIRVRYDVNGMFEIFDPHRAMDTEPAVWEDLDVKFSKLQ